MAKSIISVFRTYAYKKATPKDGKLDSNNEWSIFLSAFSEYHLVFLGLLYQVA